MVFAVWAGRKGAMAPEVAEAFRGSCRYGRERIEEIVTSESAARGFAPELVRRYLTEHIVHELGPREYQGMELFLSYARQLHSPSAIPETVPRSIVGTDSPARR
jgi:predicted solute-binding protein